MTKIIAAFDGLKFSEATTAYAVDIAKLCNAHLVGISLEDFIYHSFKLYDLLDGKEFSETKMKRLVEKDKKTRKISSLKFETTCQKAGINYSVHHDKNIALKELLHESIYADLLIIDSAETLTHFKEELPTRFVRDLLTDVQCPVLLVSNNYKPIQKIILLYDGEPSSVHAIKMLSYTIEAFNDLPTEVITVKKPDQALHVPDNKLMKEFMKRHFPKADYVVLKGGAESKIVKHLELDKQNALIVAGAYRRGAVSRSFRQSMADVLIKNLKNPLFIAHNKG